MSPRVLFAGFFHETNSFVEQPTRWEDFLVTRGEQVASRLGDQSVTDGFLEQARQLGWSVIPTLDAWALPGGTVATEAFEQFWTEFSLVAREELARGVDGLFLVLHGAMVTGAHVDAEGELLRRIRALPGAATLPLFGVVDLHANVTAEMCRLADGLVHYRKNPHTDAKECGMRGARLLARALTEKRRPHMTWCRPPIMWVPPATGSADAPLRVLAEFARELEARHPEIWEFNIAAGFSFSDMPETGVSFSVISVAEVAQDRQWLQEAAELAWSRRSDGEILYPSARAIAKTLVNAPGLGGPVLLVEPADNIGAGAPGDGTGILRALLDEGVTNALVAINDPQSVSALAGANVGETRTVGVGGRGSRLDDGPLELSVTLLSRSEGEFQLEDQRSPLAAMSGKRFTMGPCVVVVARGVTILLTSRKTPPMDLGQWTSQGLRPEGFSVIGVKAAIAHRQAYAPIARESHYVDTPGPCSSALTRLPWRHVRRPVWPLDPTTTFSCTYS